MTAIREIAWPKHLFMPLLSTSAHSIKTFSPRMSAQDASIRANIQMFVRPYHYHLINSTILPASSSVKSACIGRQMT